LKEKPKNTKQKRFAEPFPPPALIDNQILYESTIPTLHKCYRATDLIENQNGQFRIIFAIGYQTIVPAVEISDQTAAAGIAPKQQIMGSSCIFIREGNYTDIGWPCGLAWLFLHRQLQMEIWQSIHVTPSTDELSFK
jgi:hypothetical protein